MKKFFGFALAFCFAFCLCLSVCSMEFDGYIVKLRSETFCETADGSLFEEDAGSMGVSDVFSDIGLYRAEDEESLNKLEEMGIVEYYEPDWLMELYGYDASLNASYSSQKWFYDCINASFAWSSGVYGNGVTVAVIDSGVYPNVDFGDNLLSGKNYDTSMTDYDAADTTDSIGHGTRVAGLIAAECNTLSTVGLSFNAKIVPLKITDQGSFPMSRVISAIEDAVDTYGCDVINMSLGSVSSSTALKNAVDYAIGKNVIVVCAAGNKNSSNADYTYTYPASYDGVISVGNVQQSGDTLIIRETSFNNDKVDIAAPGTSILSLANADSGTRSGTGTSFACPIVAAAAALAKSVDKDITPAEFDSFMKQSADASYITESQGSDWWGSGLLNVEGLLKLVMKNAGFDGFYLSYIDVDADGNENVVITDISDTTSSGHCVFVSYYGQKKMNEVEIRSGCGIHEEFTLRNVSDLIKMFVLDGLGSLRPLSQSFVVSEGT